MTRESLNDSEFEDLSAFLDGRLDARRAAQVEGRLRRDPRRREILDELRAADRALETMAAPPAPPADLAEKVIAGVRRRRRAGPWRWVVRIGGSLAAAAAVALVAIVIARPSAPPPRRQADATAPPEGDNAAATVEDTSSDTAVLDFLRDFEVVENFETLEAIERMETASQGT